VCHTDPFDVQVGVDAQNQPVLEKCVLDHIEMPGGGSLRRDPNHVVDVPIFFKDASTPISVPVSPLQLVVPADLYIKEKAVMEDPSSDPITPFLNPQIQVIANLSASAGGSGAQFCASYDSFESVFKDELDENTVAEIDSTLGQAGTVCSPLN